jgi:hypothetical protein
VGGILDKDIDKTFKVYKLKQLIQEVSLIKDLKAIITIYKF